MKNFFIYTLVTLAGLYISCKQPVANQHDDQKVASYAAGFNYLATEYGYNLTIYNPWQGASNESITYRLVNQLSNRKIESTKNCIRVPVQRAVCLSTTHLAFMSSLNCESSIVGVSGGSYVWNSKIRELIQAGSIADVGYEQSLNFELLLSLSPDVVFAYGIGTESMGYLKRIEDLGIPVVVIGEYLENDPLAKAEWLKVFGLFFGKEELAMDVFSKIDSSYNSLKSIASNLQTRPNVFLNLPWNDVWYFPGNDSYMVQLINDAGGNYLLPDLKGNQSYPFSFEAAFVRGASADVWINLGSYGTIEQIITDFPKIKSLPVLKKRQLYNNNLRENVNGGNDFWESGVVNPHLILEDLIGIFHPELRSRANFHYYKLME